MGFEVQKAVENDFRIFPLNEIWDRYRPLQKGRHYEGGPPTLIIDRARNYFLLGLGNPYGDNSGPIRFVLWLDGIQNYCEVELCSGSSLKYSDVPYRQIWTIVTIDTPKGCSLTESEIEAIFRDALVCYSVRKVGAENTEVSFI